MENNIAKNELIARAAVLYYEYNQSQNSIADQLGISRSYVSQLLSIARSEGIVNITVNVDKDYREELFFKNTFPKLKYAYIMNSESLDFTSENIGRFAAPHITRLLKSAKNIGVNLGDTVKKAVYALDKNDFPDCSLYIKSLKSLLSKTAGQFKYKHLQFNILPNELTSSLGKLSLLTLLLLYPPIICTTVFEEQSGKSFLSRA